MDVLYEDERIIVVDKPHFLATMPRGMWYRQTALIRLRERLGEPDITPAHRLDRMTAGVLVFVRDSACPSWATTSTRASRHAPTTISASRCN